MPSGLKNSNAFPPLHVFGGGSIQGHIGPANHRSERYVELHHAKLKPKHIRGPLLKGTNHWFEIFGIFPQLPFRLETESVLKDSMQP